MEAGALPGAGSLAQPQRLLELAPDARLAGWVHEGRTEAFEALYQRYQRGILAFCRRILGDADEAEDAAQHTFLAAYRELTDSDEPIQLRAWLYTVARNRCYSIIRGRREQLAATVGEPPVEGPAVDVEAQRRQDLRDVIEDLRRLPEAQRAALVLAEVDALSHDDIAGVLGVPRERVKGLVFRARRSLVAERAARDKTRATQIPNTLQ